MTANELAECVKAAAKLRGKVQPVETVKKPKFSNAVWMRNWRARNVAKGYRVDGQKRTRRAIRYANAPGMKELKAHPKLYARAFMRLTRGKPIDDILELAKKL